MCALMLNVMHATVAVGRFNNLNILKTVMKPTSFSKDTFEIISAIDDSPRFCKRICFLVGELVPSSSLFWSRSLS